MDLEGFGSLAANTPDLSDGHCVGLWSIFDPLRDGETADSVTARHDIAKTLCKRCPVLDECRQWCASIRQADKPSGVTAGVARGEGRQAALAIAAAEAEAEDAVDSGAACLQIPVALARPPRPRTITGRLQKLAK